MKIGRLLGLAAIGGLLYAHKRRGGQFTVDSLKQSGLDLLDATKRKSREIGDDARRMRDENVRTVDASTTTGYGADIPVR